MYKQKIASIKLENDLMTISSSDLNASFNYSSVNSLYINNEMDETCREMEVSMKRMKRSEPELADLLRFNIAVNGLSLNFVVARAEGEPIAKHIEDEFRRRILSADAVPGSLADMSKKEILEEDPDEVVYPIYFHSYGFDFKDLGEA